MKFLDTVHVQGTTRKRIKAQKAPPEQPVRLQNERSTGAFKRFGAAEVSQNERPIELTLYQSFRPQQSKEEACPNNM